MLFKQGDHVLVVDPDHPAYGQTATVEVSPRQEVLTENWMGCFREIEGRKPEEKHIHYYIEFTTPIKVTEGFTFPGAIFVPGEALSLQGFDIDSEAILKE